MATKSTTKRPKALTGGSGLARNSFGCGGHIKACGGKIKRSTKRK